MKSGININAENCRVNYILVYICQL